MSKATKGDDKAALEQGFLTRWSARKQSRGDADAEPASASRPDDSGPLEQPDDPLTEAARDPAQAGGRQSPISEAEVAALPDPAQLSESSDFTPFLRHGVPESLRRLALRRLWRINPLIGHVDGLLDYDLDYTDAAMVVERIQTLYQVGKGMVVAEDRDPPADPGLIVDPAPAAGAPARDPKIADGEPGEPGDAGESGGAGDPGGEDAGNGGPGAGLEPDLAPASDALEEPGDQRQASPAKRVAPSLPAPGDAPLSQDDRPPSVAVAAEPEQRRDNPKSAGQAIKRRWGAFS